jgi:NADH:ubiquinone oxidoreductase subunit F (NADH-binding)
MRFFASESCGRCFPCRIGTERMRERLEALARPGSEAAAEARAAELPEIAAVTLAGSACGLGVAAGSVARDLVSRFPEAVREHAGGTCRARECGRS